MDEDEVSAMTECAICGEGWHSTEECYALKPGGDVAVKRGCKCPRIDNHYGKGVPTFPDGERVWWIRAACPLHGCGVTQATEAAQHQEAAEQ